MFGQRSCLLPQATSFCRFWCEIVTCYLAYYFVVGAEFALLRTPCAIRALVGHKWRLC